MEGKRLKNYNMISYGVGDIYGGGAFFIIGALFLFFLTDVGGLRPAYAGLVLMVGKIWDAVTDPAMGYISDHTRSRHGRRRLYFLWGIIPVIVSFALLWLSLNSLSQGIRFAYYLITYLLFNTVFTMVMVPYNSMPADMSCEFGERSKLITIRMACSQFGALLSAILPMTIIRSFSNERVGFIVMGLIFGIFYGLPWIMVFRGTWEREHQVEVIEGRGFLSIASEVMKDFISTSKNKALRIHIAMFLCALVAIDIFNAVLIYYLKDYLMKDHLYQTILGLVLLSEMATLVIVLRECRKRGNAKTYRLHTVILMVGILALGFISPNTPDGYFYLIPVIIGIGLSGSVMVPYNMLAFVTDVDEIISRKRRAGTYAGIMTFVRKITQALALFLVSLSLEWVGYQEKVDGIHIIQEEGTIRGIRLLFLIAPFILIVLGIIASYGFKLSPANHTIIMGEIERLRQGGSKTDVDQETQKVCEAVTGLKYEKLWDGEEGGNDVTYKSS